nr:MAG TPA: hypothetical protein [Caudoviricetes sp.]
MFGSCEFSCEQVVRNLYCPQLDKSNYKRLINRSLTIWTKAEKSR